MWSSSMTTRQPRSPISSRAPRLPAHVVQRSSALMSKKDISAVLRTAMKGDVVEVVWAMPKNRGGVWRGVVERGVCPGLPVLVHYTQEQCSLRRVGQARWLGGHRAAVHRHQLLENTKGSSAARGQTIRGSPRSAGGEDCGSDPIAASAAAATKPTPTTHCR